MQVYNQNSLKLLIPSFEKKGKDEKQQNQLQWKNQIVPEDMQPVLIQDAHVYQWDLVFGLRTNNQQELHLFILHQYQLERICVEDNETSTFSTIHMMVFFLLVF